MEGKKYFGAGRIGAGNALILGPSYDIYFKIVQITGTLVRSVPPSPRSVPDRVLGKREQDPGQQPQASKPGIPVMSQDFRLHCKPHRQRGLVRLLGIPGQPSDPHQISGMS